MGNFRCANISSNCWPTSRWFVWRRFVLFDCFSNNFGRKLESKNDVLSSNERKNSSSFSRLQGLLNALCTAAVVMAWTGLFVGVLFFILKLLKILNVSKDEELRGEKKRKRFSFVDVENFDNLGIDLFQHGEPAYALRIYCAACGEQLQGKGVEQETAVGSISGVRTNFPSIVTDAEGGKMKFSNKTKENLV